ncbi:RibD C-terminal domain [Serratia grimesii]|uniref:dihydrofolate reductase family protein n=1 Tax=Serratia grimesii TaxID=82995 RepID=UPI00217810AC|nr:dihydrofolate reductase family protein [Serratia grimesii]CAI1583622.1 RibD C-terminal domain [Serratia grimesii]
MRQIIVGAFISLDGVMQAPGGPQEDTTGGFQFGGWTVPYWDDSIAAAMGDTFSQPFDLLLGRKTYDIFAAHWPRIETDPNAEGFEQINAEIANTFNRATKYVATHHGETLTWENSQWLSQNVAARLREIKTGQGPALVVQGSTELIQLLLSEDLVDELRLLTYPLVLGDGKRLFGNGASPAAFKLVKSVISPSGVIIAHYQRAGNITTGSFALEASEAK